MLFETVGLKISQIAIPDWVFKDLGQPVEERNFRYEDIIYPMGQRRAMGSDGLYNRSKSGKTFSGWTCEHLPYIDHGNNNWFCLITLVRDYAAKHARRHMLLCNGHVPTGGALVSKLDKSIFDGVLYILLKGHSFPVLNQATVG